MASRARSARPRPTRLNPAVLDQKLARQEGLVTLWDLPDILISRGKGLAVRLRLPPERDGGHRRCRSGWCGGAVTRRRPRRSSTTWGARRASCSRRARSTGSLRGVTCPLDSLPAWVGDVERDDEGGRTIDWELLAGDGAAWMGYWDQHVRGTGRTSWRRELGLYCGEREWHFGEAIRTSAAGGGSPHAHAGAGRDAGPAGAQRQREDDDAAAARRVRGARRRPRARRRRGRHAASRPWRGASAWCSSTTRCSPTSTWVTTWRSASNARGARRRAATAGSRSALDAGRPGRVRARAGRDSSRGASSSAWPSRARWRRSRRCCCSTSRSPTSTPRCASGPGASCAS